MVVVAAGCRDGWEHGGGAPTSGILRRWGRVWAVAGGREHGVEATARVAYGGGRGPAVVGAGGGLRRRVRAVGAGGRRRWWEEAAAVGGDGLWARVQGD
ncbi:hypothetical protein GUJ93_ZPchr0013g34879 [Zizania palustris]|uniref:Uncharacterized protein n=1 Tax=Zizania palustris TaxID=103762 RepID=A0A8J5X9S0_ZIZPA|nr:hypothetical protein GUJ93_ZPchr0013g34879 [Zizania palustris]